MPQLLSFSQPMPAARPSREVIVAIFLSLIIHMFPALILWVMATNRIVVEPVAPSIGKTLIVSLTTLPDTAHEEPDIKDVTAIPAAVPLVQHSQRFSELTSVVGHMSEAEIVVTSQLPDIPASETPEANHIVTDKTLSFDRKSLYRMEWSFGNIPEIKVKGIETSTGKGGHGSGASEGNSLSSYLTPSYGLDAVNRFEQVFGEMADSELQRKKIEWRVDYIKKYEASVPPDCRTAYAKKGLLAIPYFIRDAIIDSDKACTW